jgi:hypothetical protein
MSDAGNQWQRNGSIATETPDNTGSEISSSARSRAYQAPRLRYLGSVRELTLGSQGIACDNQTPGSGQEAC